MREFFINKSLMYRKERRRIFYGKDLSCNKNMGFIPGLQRMWRKGMWKEATMTNYSYWNTKDLINEYARQSERTNIPLLKERRRKIREELAKRFETALTYLDNEEHLSDPDGIWRIIVSGTMFWQNRGSTRRRSRRFQTKKKGELCLHIFTITAIFRWWIHLRKSNRW